MKHVPKRHIMHEVGRLWREITPAELLPYEKLSARDLDRFKLEHAAFVRQINSRRHANEQP